MRRRGAIFPSTFSTVAMIVGGIWLIQGLGIADTGSFMDGQPVWAVSGGILLLVGLGSSVAKRRRRQTEKPGSPG